MKRDVCEKILISEKEINEKVKQLGLQISKDYSGKEFRQSRSVVFKKYGSVNRNGSYGV